ncbi:hypothetical protein MTCD1_01456 [Colwellia marinimaniae]|uniref:Uncharacterized protein n=1 Tax=Colwellia marinimaniae TaxID=1513592 RepID=A0ABQ0MTZ7_9GAMM|nr:hypothetical protein MTCD1_01456 [Colwellia marinimaniae]
MGVFLLIWQLKHNFVITALLNLNNLEEKR